MNILLAGLNKTTSKWTGVKKEGTVTGCFLILIKVKMMGENSFLPTKFDFGFCPKNAYIGRTRGYHITCSDVWFLVLAL